MPTHSLHAELEALDAFAARALVPSDSVRQVLLADVAASSGLHPTSVARLADAFLDAWRRPHLDRLVAAAWTSTCATRPVGTVAIAAPGNLCVATWAAMAEALLAGNRVRVRPGAGDPLAPASFQRALALVAPELAERIEIAPSGRTDDVGWRHWLAGARALMAYGSDAGVAAVVQRALALGFVGQVRLHGTRASLGAVRAAAVTGPDSASLFGGLLHDALVADGRGCMSLRALWVVGPIATDTVAHAVAGALAEVSRSLPAGHVAQDLGAEAALAAADHELAAACDPASAAFVCSSDAWVAVHQCRVGACRALGPGARGLVVHIVEGVEDVGRALGGVALSTVAIAPHGDRALQAWASQSGASRVCGPGQMQAPPCWAAHDGVRPFTALAERCDDADAAQP